MSSKLAVGLDNVGAVTLDPPLRDSTIQSLRVFKGVCIKIRNSLLAGSNEVVSPTAVSRELIKANADKLSGSCPNGIGVLKKEEASSAMETGREASFSFLEPAEGWTIEYGGSWCEVSAFIVHVIVGAETLA